MKDPRRIPTFDMTLGFENGRTARAGRIELAQ